MNRSNNDTYRVWWWRRELLVSSSWGAGDGLLSRLMPMTSSVDSLKFLYLFKHRLDSTMGARCCWSGATRLSCCNDIARDACVPTTVDDWWVAWEEVWACTVSIYNNQEMQICFNNTTTGSSTNIRSLTDNSIRGRQGGLAPLHQPQLLLRETMTTGKEWNKSNNNNVNNFSSRKH